MSLISGRVGLQQRVLPAYRAPLFDLLAQRCPQGLSIFAGQPRPTEMIAAGASLQNAHYYPANNLHLLKGGLYLCWQSNLLDWLEDWQPYTLILEANPRYIHSPAAMRWIRRRGGKLIGWGLGAPAAKGLLARARLAARRRFLQQFDALLTYSNQGAAEYVASGIPRERIFVAPNAAAPRPTHALPPRLAEFGSGAVVLFVGRLQARKRLDLLLHACAQLEGEVRPQVWIVGEGEMRPSLEQLAAQVYPQTRFFGAKQGAELEPFFRAADLFVLPGTGGLAVQQAMSFGLPVMVAESDGTQVDLVRPENGWQLPAGDGAALKAALQNALADLPRLRQMGAASFRIVVEEINLEHMVDVFAQALAFVGEGV